MLKQKENIRQRKEVFHIVESEVVGATGSVIKKSHITQFNIGNYFGLSNSLHLFRINISKKQLLDKLLILLKVVVEYAFGMHIGYAVGWIIGLYVGQFYVEHFEPVYFEDLSRLDYWRLAPYMFARNSAMIGVVVGMISIAVVNSFARGHGEGPASSDKVMQFLG